MTDGASVHRLQTAGVPKLVQSEEQTREFLRVVPEGAKIILVYKDPITGDTCTGISGNCEVQDMDHMFMSLQRRINEIAAKSREME